VAYVIGDESDSGPAEREAMRSGDLGFPEPTLRWLLPGQEVDCGIADIPGTL
jgi:hypothetical protein